MISKSIWINLYFPVRSKFTPKGFLAKTTLHRNTMKNVSQVLCSINLRNEQLFLQLHQHHKECKVSSDVCRFEKHKTCHSGALKIGPRITTGNKEQLCIRKLYGCVKSLVSGIRIQHIPCAIPEIRIILGTIVQNKTVLHL